jgi:hypothetical protein
MRARARSSLGSASGGCRRPLPGGHNAGTRWSWTASPTSSACCRRALSGREALGDRQGVVIDPWRFWPRSRSCAGRGRHRLRDLRIAENAASSCPSTASSTGRARRQGQGQGAPGDRHDRPRHRPGLRGQGGAPRDPRCDLADDAVLSRSWSSCSCTQRAEARPRGRRDRWHRAPEQLKALAPSSCPSPSPSGSGSRISAGPAGASSSRVRKVPCSMSIRHLPFVTSSNTGAGRRPRARASGRTRWAMCSASPSPTPRAWAPAVPHRALRRGRQPARRARPRVRHGYGPKAPLRLVRRRPRAPGGQDGGIRAWR